MAERASVLPFPRWLIAVDLVAAVLVVAGLLIRKGVVDAAALPVHADLLLLGLGGLGVVACAVLFGRHALSAAASSRSSR